MRPWTSYPFPSRSSASQEPSWPVIPVISAVDVICGRNPLPPAVAGQRGRDARSGWVLDVYLPQLVDQAGQGTLQTWMCSNGAGQDCAPGQSSAQTPLTSSQEIWQRPPLGQVRSQSPLVSEHVKLQLLPDPQVVAQPPVTARQATSQNAPLPHSKTPSPLPSE